MAMKSFDTDDTETNFNYGRGSTILFYSKIQHTIQDAARLGILTRQFEPLCLVVFDFKRMPHRFSKSNL